MAELMKINKKNKSAKQYEGGGVEPKRQRIKLTKSTSTRTVFCVYNKPVVASTKRSKRGLNTIR